MRMENEDDATKSKEKSSQPSNEDAELKHRQPSMNYAWYDDEGKLDAMIEALRKLPIRQRSDENKKL